MHSSYRKEIENAGAEGLYQVGLAFAAFVIVILFFSFADPRSHLYASVPMVALSLCPLIRLPIRRRAATRLFESGQAGTGSVTFHHP